MALVHSTRERVAITTPYFFPNEPMLQALQSAVLRGVDVHLIVSERTGQLLVNLKEGHYEASLAAPALGGCKNALEPIPVGRIRRITWSL